jgi:DNA polymerase I-like protein with 3'-5' exonuclease and polymerase domains
MAASVSPPPGPPSGPFLFCIDLETFLIEQGGGAPPPVCAGWTAYDAGVVQNGVVHVNGDAEGDWTPTDGAPSALAQLYRWGIERVRVEAAKGRVARFINQNIPFDLGVVCAAYPELIPLVFEAYDEGIVEDTMIREQLIDIAAGSLGWVRGVMSPRGTRVKRAYTLKDMAKRRLGIDMDKTTWRLGYADLVDVPLAKWPQGAKDYAIDDTGIAIDVYLSQRAELTEDVDTGEVPNSIEQARAHWALHLMSTWGIRTDGARVARYKHELELRLRVLSDALSAVGFIRGPGIKGKKEGTKDKKLIEDTIVELHASDRWPAGHELARTEKGAVSMTAQAMDDLLEALDLNLVPMKALDVDDGKGGRRKKEPVEFALDLARTLPVTPGDTVTDLDGHPVPKKIAALALLAWHTSTQKLLGTYVPWLDAGAKYPINCRYQPLVESGRSSCTSPNLQNLPKERGVRECYRARPGTVLSSVDYEALELHTLAQACLTLLGKSKLAEALNDGVDPHLLLATEFLLDGIAYDEGKKIRKDEKHPRHKEVVHARNMAKIANFGLPGALSAKTLVRYAKAGGIIIDLEAATELKAKWFKAWPEMKDYFEKISASLYLDDDGEQVATVEQLYSARIRGGARYTAACNSLFQGLAADLAKAACYELAKACYVSGHNAILYGSRPVVFIHDETICEHPVETAHERAMEQARIMIEAGKPFCPDVPLKAEPALMFHWSKDAVAVYDEHKRLVSWMPQGEK